jgi:hypothetical protein
MPEMPAEGKRSRRRDFWQLDVPLVVVLTLCIVITIIEYRRANEGVWRAWIYLFEWPMIAGFAVWIWYRFKHEGGRAGFVQKWKARVAQYEAEDDAARQARAEEAQRREREEAQRRLADDPELARWRDYQAEVRGRDEGSAQD